jgi:hypothetical protein
MRQVPVGRRDNATGDGGGVDNINYRRFFLVAQPAGLISPKPLPFPFPILHRCRAASVAAPRRLLMRAIQVTKTGGPEVLECVEVPKPEIKHGQVLVRIHAIDVGKPDVLVRTGVYKWMPPLPAIPGIEATGHVVALGADVQGLRVGE